MTVPVNRKFCWSTMPIWRCSESRVDVGDVVAVDEHLAAGGQIELGDEVDDRAFAAAGLADEGDGLAGLGGEVDVVQDRLLRIVAEGDVLELDAAVDRRAVRRRRRGRPTAGLGVQQPKHALRAGHGAQRLVVLRATICTGWKNSGTIMKKPINTPGSIFACGCKNPPAAHHQHHRHEHL